MRILVLTTDFGMNARWGMGHQLRVMVEGIRAYNKDAQVVVCHPGPEDSTLSAHNIQQIVASPVANEMLLRADTGGWGSYSCFRLLEAWNIALACRILSQSNVMDDQIADVIHCNGWMCWRLAHMLSKHWRIPVVLSLHVVERQYEMVGAHPGGVDQELILGVESEAVRMADLVTVPSATAHDLALRLIDTATPAKLAVVPHGVDVESLSRGNLASKSCVELLYMGRLAKEKGIYEFLQAAQIVQRQHPHVVVRVIGDGPEFAAAKSKIANDANVDDDVGFVSQIGFW